LDFDALVDDYVDRLWAGTAPDPDDVILAHPDYAAALDPVLRAAARVHAEVQALPAVGRYRLLARIGAGASAVVFRGIDTASRRPVAVKVFPPTARAVRFDRDLRALGRLKHPGIVQFLDHGVADGRPYLVLELIEGGSLADRLAVRPPFDPPAAARLVAALAAAAQHAHDQSLIHRDIKPGNVLLGPGDEPQLTDFGLARALDLDPVTRTGDALGTPRYMAPEQVRGGPVDARTDVYGLGTVLYELLAGRRSTPRTRPP
jgi:eukaryotic-like serine/threonine-protein kinase